MECKCYQRLGNPPAGYELIDTLWNVNELSQFFNDVGDSELIDTLWNVNVFMKTPLMFAIVN